MPRYVTSPASLPSHSLRGLSLAALLALLLCLPAKPLWAAGTTLVTNDATGGNVSISLDAYNGNLVNGGNRLVVVSVGTSLDADPGSIYANAVSGKLTDNILTIKGGSVGTDTTTTGTHIVAASYRTSPSEASNSHIYFEGGTAHGAGGIDMYGGGSSDTARDNSIIVTGGSITGSVTLYGGQGLNGATNNKVEIKSAINTTSGNIYGGLSTNNVASGNSVLLAASSTNIGGSVNGGVNNQGNAENNTVEITATASIGGDLYGGSTWSGNASGNSVLLAASGTSIGGNVYGGSTTTQGNAENNTVDITAPVSIGGDLYGGYARSGTSSGNTLIVRSGDINITGTVSHFQKYHFYLTDSMKGKTLVTAGGAVSLGSASVGVAAVQGSRGWSIGDTVTLIKSNTGITASSALQNNFSAMSGISKVYDFGLEIIDGKNLVAKVQGAKASDEVIRKSPAEGKAASVTTVTQGADLVAGKGMNSAREAARAAGAAQGAAALASFGAVSGGASTYNTGSHVDVQGFAFMAGIAKRLPLSGVDALIGVFFETGFGSYNSYNDRNDGGGEIRGWGNSRYYGGGLMGRLEWTEGAAKGLYTELSARMGSLYSDYRSDDLNPALGQASYDINSLYYGVHAGLGYIWQMTDKASLDMYGKYFWTHTKGGDVRILGDPVTFDDVDSHRVRAGARFSYAATEHVAPYVGAAWEHEFAGDARSTVAGESVAAPSLKGSSGLGELGITWKPTGSDALSIDLGVQGYVGMRQGITGSLQMKLEF